MTTRKTIVALTVTVALALASQASAQSFPTGQTAADNSRAGSVAARDPGNMVIAGVAQTLAAADAGRAGVVITATSRPTSVRAGLLAESIQLLFSQLTEAIELVHVLLLARNGGPPTFSRTIKADLSDASPAPVPGRLTKRLSGRR